MDQKKDLHINVLKQQAQRQREENCKLQNPFTWVNSFDINSKGIPSLMNIKTTAPYELKSIPSLMDIKTKAPYVLNKYSIPPRNIDYSRVCNLSIHDPRNKLYYQQPTRSTTKGTITIPLNSTLQIASTPSKVDHFETVDQDILEIYAPEFDSDL